MEARAQLCVDLIAGAAAGRPHPATLLQGMDGGGRPPPMPAEGPGPPPSGFQHGRRSRSQHTSAMVAGSPVLQACGAPPQTRSRMPDGAIGSFGAGTSFSAQSGPRRSWAVGWASLHLREEV
ncbi:hypothetical protein NDU88_005209 [Pleurodeles waltl]|uniref:Uncharacterized protein n=1 Tax=Pleurodeles waltl TaxID=8319 RepID=A0AAV7UHH1_PLEWA|nr:hypothetical protein NDU88_005209 [Pleurodeles waltl]